MHLKLIWHRKSTIVGCLEKLQKQTNKKINILEDTRELGVPSRRNSICKDPGAGEKSQGAVKKRTVWKWPRWCREPSHHLEPSHPERGQTGKVIWGCIQLGLQYHSSCSSFYHFRLLSPYSLDHILISAITLLCTLSLSLQDSSICQKLGIPFHESVVPTCLLDSQINLESLCVHLWITLKWNIVDLSFSLWHVRNVLPAWSTVWGYSLLDPPTPPKRGLVVKLLKHLVYT